MNAKELRKEATSLGAAQGAVIGGVFLILAAPFMPDTFTTLMSSVLGIVNLLLGTWIWVKISEARYVRKARTNRLVWLAKLLQEAQEMDRKGEL